MRRQRLCLALLAAALAGPPAAPAHDIPKENHDRALVVRLTPGAVEVEYLLEVDEAHAVKEDLKDVDLSAVTTRQGLHDRYAAYFAPVLANNLDAKLDGRPLEFTCARRRSRPKDHIRCEFVFRAPWAPAPGARHAFTFADGNFHGDDFSALRLEVKAAPGVTVHALTAPDEALMGLHPDRRGPGVADRLRKASATFSVAEGASPTSLSGDKDSEKEEESPGPTKLLHLLLDTRQGVGLLLLLAGAFGAVHALTPGHGKAMVAAYLVGERGTVWHALLLGLVVTLTHTAAVLVLAAALPLLFPGAVPATVQAVLGMVGGLLIAGLGLWLLMCRLSGRADHVHLGGGHHHHHHGHGHEHGVPAEVKPGVWGLVVLGVSGGIVPCWDAIAMLFFAISAQRLWLGLPLLLAFSAGLAAVLIGLGVAVVRARDVVSARWGGGERFRAVVRALPLASAALITALGLWLCYDSARGVRAGGPVSAPSSTPAGPG